MLKRLKDIFSREEFDLLGAESSVQSLPLFQQIITGSTAGMCEHLGLFPVDTIKASERPQGFIKTAKLLYRYQGIRRFYRGALPIVCGCIPAHGAFFGTYEFAKRQLNIENGEYHPITGFLVGACASIIHDAILTPMDGMHNVRNPFIVFKQRMQLSGCQRILRYARMVVKTEGASALFRSLPITIMMNLPYSSMLVALNENLKIYVQPKKHKHKFLLYFVCASVAGTIASVVTNPLDVVKTRLQTQNMAAGLTKDTSDEVMVGVKYRDILSSAKTMIKEEGTRSFSRGIVPRVLQASTSSALSWVTYEFVKHLFLSYR